MIGTRVPAGGSRSGWMAVGLVAGFLALVPALAEAQATPPRLFPSDGGMVLNFIKPDKTADFEEVIAKLKEALAKSDKPGRREQARGWRVFRSPDPAGGNVLYVFVIDPSVKDADYNVSTIIAEAFPPEEVNALYQKYADAYAQGQNIVNLTLISDLGR